jgi:hypothetical protein
MSQLESLFSVLNMDLWDRVLTPEDHLYLRQFLPALDGEGGEEEKKNLTHLFNGENFNFGNPIVNFFDHFKGIAIFHSFLSFVYFFSSWRLQTCDS